MRQDNPLKYIRLFAGAILLALVAMILPVIFAHADDGGAVVAPAVDPTLDFLKLLLDSLGGMKGASTLAIVGIVVQLLIKLVDLPLLGSLFSGSKGWVKLVIVSGLTFALAPITLVQTQGLTWGAALVHSATLTAFMVFANQVYQHFAPAKA